MRAVLQRVTEAAVRNDGIIRRTGRGLVALVAVRDSDSDRDAEYIADKTASLRIFSDTEGKLNHSVLDVGGEVLAVSQFTLYGDCSHGRRPGFSKCAGREKGLKLFNLYVDKLVDRGIRVKTGFFGENMEVTIVNDGPVTIIIES